MYLMTSFHSVFGVTALLLLSVLSTFLIVVSALDGYVEPGEPVVEQGTDLHLNCTLSNVPGPGSQTARDIVWRKGSRTLPTDWYSAISDSVSQLSLFNVTFDQSSTYSCSFQEDEIQQRVWVQVLVGTKPEPVKLECIIRNPDEYRCNWEETTNTNLRTTHLFQFHPFSGGVWRDCPSCTICEENTCFVGITDNTGVRQEVQVKTTNILGEAVMTQSFDPFNDVVVNPPRNVVVTPLVTETSLKITWFLPEEWHTVMTLLEYRLRYNKVGCQTNLTFCQWEQVSDLGKISSLEYKLQGLEPYTEYVIQLAARFGVDDKNWSEWTPVKAVYTRQTLPSETVGNLTANEMDIFSSDLRDVYLEWEELQVQNQHGIILGYNIKVFRTEGSEVTEVDELSSTGKLFKVQGLQKYFSYQIKVAAFNQAGTGPWTSVLILDRTTAPAAPDWVQAVALTTTSINVTWGAPSKPNGIIQSYIVQWRKSNTDNMQSYLTHNASYRHHVLEQLDTYVLYEVTVKARNSRGEGQIALLLGGARTLPGVPDAAPSGLTVEPINNQPDSFTLAWEPLPIANINGDLQGYLIGYCQSKSRCTGEFLHHMNLTSPDVTSATIKGLEPSTQYSVWLAVYTSAGLGPDSDHILATTKNEASVIVVPAVVGPLFIGLFILIVICCVLRQVINSRSIPDPKIARDVDVMKMNGAMSHCHIHVEQEVFDNMPGDDSQTDLSHPLESAYIEDLKKQSFKFSRSESNDSGFPPSPARSSANLDYLRDKLSNGDNDDSVFEEEHGRMQKDMHKKSSGLTSRTSQSDSVGPYTMVGELPFLKIPLSSGLGQPSVKGPSVAESTPKEQHTDSSRLRGSPSSPSVDVSPYTQMSALSGSRPAQNVHEPRQKENQKRNKLPTVGSIENETTQIKEVSPYTLMSAMSSVPHRQPKRCQEPSVGASKCKKQTHHLGSAPTLSVPSQMLAMEANNHKSPPESPSTVSPYSKLEDLNLPTRSANSSNNPTTNSSQLVSPSTVSPYSKLEDLNPPCFSANLPNNPTTNSTQPVSPSNNPTTNSPQLVSPSTVSPYSKLEDLNPPCFSANLPNNRATNSTQPVSPYIIQMPEVNFLIPRQPQAKEVQHVSPKTTTDNQTHKPVPVLPQPVSPYTQTPEVKPMQPKQPRIPPPAVESLTCKPPALTTNPAASKMLISDTAGSQPLDPLTVQAIQQKEVPSGISPNVSPSIFQKPVSPYIQVPGVNDLQLTLAKSDRAKQHPLSGDEYHPPSPHTLQQSVLPNIQMPRIEQTPQQSDHQRKLPPDTDLNNTPHASSDHATPYIMIPDINSIQLNKQQTNEANQDLSSNTNGPLAQQQTVPTQPKLKTPQPSKQDIMQQQASPGATSSKAPVLSQSVSPYNQMPEPKMVEPKDLAPSSENQAQSSQSASPQAVSPEPGTPYTQNPEPETLQLGPQQASHSKELNSISGSSENQARNPQSVSPEPGSPYVQVPEPETLQLGPQQASHSKELNSISGSSENQARNPHSVSPEPGSSYVQVPEPETLQLGPQQASHSKELNSISGSSENQARNPQSVSPEPGSPCVQVPEPETLQLSPQQASHSKELNSSSGSSENQAHNPQSVSPDLGSPYVQTRNQSPYS